MFYGELELSTAFAPRDWHVHEMLYGYLPAVITGFLLTAVPNWTGRMPLQGRPLLVLVSGLGRGPPRRHHLSLDRLGGGSASSTSRSCSSSRRVLGPGDRQG